MGLNTTILLLNDYIPAIDQDPKHWWDELHRSINDPRCMPSPILGGKILGIEHSSSNALFAVGGNTGKRLAVERDDNFATEDLLRAAAKTLGYRLVRRK